MEPDINRIAKRAARDTSDRGARRRLWVLSVLAVLSLLLATGGFTYAVLADQDGRDRDEAAEIRAAERSAANAATAEANAETAAEARRIAEETRIGYEAAVRQLRDLGEQPEIELPSVGTRGATLVRPSLSQIAEAISSDVDAAVLAACGGDCRGEPGDAAEPLPPIVPRDGTDGQDGQNGTDGQDGRDGQDGVGIVGLRNCEGGLASSFQFEVVYSDGSSQVISCGMLPPVTPPDPPEPEPEPTPSPE